MQGGREAEKVQHEGQYETHLLCRHSDRIGSRVERVYDRDAQSAWFLRFPIDHILCALMQTYPCAKVTFASERVAKPTA